MNDLTGPTRSRGNGRKAKAHPFKIDDAETLMAGRNNKDVAAGQLLGHLSIGQETAKHHPCLQVQFACQRFACGHCSRVDGGAADDVERERTLPAVVPAPPAACADPCAG